MIELTQYNAEKLKLSAKPQKIISLVPSITENLIQFGTKPVARTSFCIEPKDVVKDIPVIGGTKTPRVSKIISMKPDLVIANQEENIRKHIEEIRDAGIPVWITFPKDVGDVVELMKELMTICEDTYAASNWIEKTKEILSCPQPPKFTAVTLIWKNPWMAAGVDTYSSHLLSHCGFQNPILGRYPEISEQEIRELSPDIIILPTEPYAFDSEDMEYWGKIAPTLSFDGEDLLWSGTRLVRAIPRLMEIAKQFKKKTIK